MLARNYRSTPAVVALAEVALGPAAGRRAPAPGGDPRRWRRADHHCLRRRRGRSESRRRGVLAEPRRRRAVAPHGGALPHQRAVVALRDRVHPAGGAVPDRRRAALRRAAPVRAVLDQLRESERTAPGSASRIISPSSRPTTNTTSPTRRPWSRDAHRAAVDEARAHRDALLELGRDFVEAGGGSGGVTGFTAWLDISTAAADRTERRRRSRHLPSRQGPRMVGRVRHRPRTRHGPDLVVDLRRRAGRGAAPAARGAEPGRGRAALFVGPDTVGRHSPHGPRTLAVARDCSKTRRTTHRTACCRAAEVRATTSPSSAPRSPKRRRRARRRSAHTA